MQKVYKDAIDSEFCDEIVAQFDLFESQKLAKIAVASNEVGELDESEAVTAIDDYLSEERWLTLKNRLNYKYIVPALTDYLADYKYIDYNKTRLIDDAAIISRYPIGRGQFKPHQDAFASKFCEYLRSLTIICYLNDVNVGGETYFFNQDKYVKPKKGNILIFPSGFTFGHEGRLPISEDKYIIVTFAEVMLED